MLDIDIITAEMYGVFLRGKENQIPFSKNGIEPLDELEEEIDSAIGMIDYEFFAPSKEKFWEDNFI
ncbi:MAG: hypothetical protein ACE5EJ_02805 [Nitrosopumilaceae archaeon]